MKNPKNGEYNADWHRLYEVIRRSGMSTNAFAYHIGLPRAENLYQIKKGNHGISKQLAQTINRIYPEFSVAWLLSGEKIQYSDTTNLLRIGNTTIRKIPVFVQFDDLATPVYHSYLSEDILNGATIAVINKDESLAPKIPVGTIVLLKPGGERIVYGEIYLIALPDYAMIRKIRSTPHPDEFRLEAIDRDNYDDIIINRSKIKEIFAVEKLIGFP